MPKYILDFENQGYEIGGSYPDDSVELELTETEEQDLINLIRQKNSSDIYIYSESLGKFTGNSKKNLQCLVAYC